ncbi:hypothetical protein L1987_47167 [Smallanthus sonchifolius]|uniref:Uncharacterized protein n=1 Tax=Smallanthus sonchifolius TaxID=185202 RepID=A0ACB9G1T3_9ASTR|nr:hypothetical protein L1987_47167 [Smallanthus sonchifolius]
MGAKNIEARVESLLVSGQVNGTYDVKEPAMILYLEQVKNLVRQFDSCTVGHIKRSENKQADALSKLASTSFSHLEKEVRVEVLTTPSVLRKQVNVIQTGARSWTTPILNYLSTGILPEEKPQARKLQHKALHYQLQEGVLYRRSYLGPLLRCVDAEDSNYIVREIHEGICGMHAGPRMIVEKIMSTGYYWPVMHMDAIKELRKCQACQRYVPRTIRPKNNLIPVTTTWPFQKWATDILGPFLEAPRRVKFLIVSIDYFTKWVEAKPLTTITVAQVKKFLWENVICRFGLPMHLVSDNGTQFADKKLQEWCAELGIKQIFTSVHHPQGNGQVERANRSLVEGIKAGLDQWGHSWVDELPHVLWAHHTSLKTSNGETPISLTYGSKAVIPAEIGVPSARVLMASKCDNDQEIRINLDLLDERREEAALKEARYKKKLEKYYNARVKICKFNVGEYVLRDNEASEAEHPGKLSPNWEGQYQIAAVLGKGARVKICKFNVGEYVLRDNEASEAEHPGKLSPNWEGPYQIAAVLGKGAYELRKLDGTLIPRS